MERFIAHFDILGYKEFILNNDIAYINQENDRIFRESQSAVARDGAYVQLPGSLTPDVRTAEISCLHFSDTIIFWTSGATESDFVKLLYTCSKFNFQCNFYSFPVRGAIGFGDFTFNPYNIAGQNGAHFYNSSLFGKALVDTYLKAEAQDWAGCYIDDTALEAHHGGNKIVSERTIYDLLYAGKIIYYPVPFKGGASQYKHCLRLLEGPLNNTGFRNKAKNIETRFKAHMKGKLLDASVERKMKNTIDFLAAHIENSVQEDAEQ